MTSIFNSMFGVERYPQENADFVFHNTRPAAFNALVKFTIPFSKGDYPVTACVANHICITLGRQIAGDVDDIEKQSSEQILRGATLLNCALLFKVIADWVTNAPDEIREFDKSIQEFIGRHKLREEDFDSRTHRDNVDTINGSQSARLPTTTISSLPATTGPALSIISRASDMALEEVALVDVQIEAYYSDTHFDHYITNLWANSLLADLGQGVEQE